MKSYIGRISILALGMILAAILVSPKITRANDWNKLTYFSVNQPFELPGVTLAPNTTYVLKILPLMSERSVVQVFNADQSKCLSTFFGIRDFRLEPTGRTVFSFAETSPGYPKVVKSWFYPGDVNGLEFIYPMSQARNIVQHAQDSILATSNNVNTAMADINTFKVETLSPHTSSLTTASSNGR